MTITLEEKRRRNREAQRRYVKKHKHTPQFKSRRRKDQKKYRKSNPATMMWHGAKARAKYKSLPFDIDKDDVQIPEF